MPKNILAFNKTSKKIVLPVTIILSTLIIITVLNIFSSKSITQTTDDHSIWVRNENSNQIARLNIDNSELELKHILPEDVSLSAIFNSYYNHASFSEGDKTFKININGELEIDKTGNHDQPPDIVSESESKELLLENVIKRPDEDAKLINIYKYNDDYLALWESELAIYVYNSGSIHKLKDKSDSGDVYSANKLHNLRLFYGEKLVINALSTGEVWVYDAGIWNIIPSTKNNWQTKDMSESVASQYIEAKENVCPVASNINSFGVRPGRYNLVPAIYAVADANPMDQIYITEGTIVGNSLELNTSNNDLQIVEGKYIGINITEHTIGHIIITFKATDFGSDSHGFCNTDISISLNVIPQGAPNHPPLFIGNQISEKYRTVSTEKIVQIDMANGWLDPEGDDIFLANIKYDDNLILTTTKDNILNIKALNNTETSTQISYQICDIHNLCENNVIIIYISSSPSIIIDDIFIKTDILSEIKVDLTKYLQSELNSFPVITSHPPQIQVKNDNIDATVSITANKPGIYIVGYSCNLSKLCDEQNIEGRIIITANDYETKSSPNCANNSWTQNTNHILMHDEEGKILAFDNLISNDSHTKYNIKSILNNPNLNIGNFTVSQLNNEQLYIDATLRKVMDEKFVNLGNFSVETADVINGNTKVFSFEVIILTDNKTKSIPIAKNDTVVATPGSLNKLHVLRNDLIPSNSDIKIDKNFFANQEDVSSLGVITPGDDTLGFIPPKNNKNDTVIKFKYRIFNEYCPLTCRDIATVTVLIRGNIPDPDNSNFSDQVDILSANTAYLKKFGITTGEATPKTDNMDINETTQQILNPVGIRNQFYGTPMQKVALGTLKPLDNDYIPDGYYTKMSAIYQVDSSSNNINENHNAKIEDIENFSIVFGQTSNNQIYELTVKTYSDGSNPLLGDADTELGNYTQRLVFSVAIETIDITATLSDDIIVAGDSISQDHHFKTPLNIDNYTTTDGDDAYLSDNIVTHKILCAFDCESLSISDSGHISGEIGDNEQIFVILSTIYNSENNENTENSANRLIWTSVFVPSLSGLKPMRNNNRFISVKVGSEVDINIDDEMQNIPTFTLEISGYDGEKPSLYGVCNLADNHLKYVAPKTMDSEDYLTDYCAVNMKYAEFAGSDNLIYFKIIIASEHSVPKLVGNINLEPIAPKESTTLNLNPYIVWIGQNAQNINLLRIKCESTDESNINVNCEGLNLNINSYRESREFSKTDINIWFICEADCSNHSSFNVSGINTISQPIKSGVKFTNIEIPLIDEDININEGINDNSLSVDVLSHVQKWLQSPQYYGFQSGGQIKCLDSESEHLRCTNNDTAGNLKFTVINAMNGMNLVGRFAFTDRADDRMPNYGSGSILIHFRAKPKTPMTPMVDESAANIGNIKITVQENIVSIPGITELCINVADNNGIDTFDRCKVANNGTANFTLDTELISLIKWHSYSVLAYSLSIIGRSQPTDSIIVTPFTPIDAPNVTWQPIADGHIELAINDTMSDVGGEHNIVNYFEIASNAGGTTTVLNNSQTNIIRLSAAQIGVTNNRFVAISVKACGRPVTSGAFNINTGCSRTTNISVFTPGRFGGNDLLTHTVAAANSTNTNTGVTFTVSQNSKLVSSIFTLPDNISITYRFRFIGGTCGKNSVSF